MVKKNGKFVHCTYCGKSVWKRNYILKTQKNYFCNLKCFHEYSKRKTKYKIVDDYAEFYVFDKDGKKYTAYIDKEDVKFLNCSYTPIFYKSSASPYLMNSKAQNLHRLIMNCPKGLVVDHINHNTLDNRKSNLRICTRGENVQNLKSHNSNSSTKIRNVYLNKRRNKFEVRMIAYGRLYTKGYFPNTPKGLEMAEEAAIKLRKSVMPYSTN